LWISKGIYHGAAQHRRAKGSVDDATEGYPRRVSGMGDTKTQGGGQQKDL